MKEEDTIFHEGRHFVRVSKIVSDDEFLSCIPPHVLLKKQQIGTDTHHAIEDYLNGEFCVLNTSSLMYFNSFKAWDEHLKPRFLVKEKRYFCKDRFFTGQVDCIVQFEHEDFPAVVDFKTSAQESKSWVLQGHLYHVLARQEISKLSPNIYFVKLSGLGAVPKVFRYTHSEETEQKCLKMVENYWKGK